MRSEVRPGQKHGLYLFYLKNNLKKRGWGMAQVIEHLSSKHKALSSRSSTAKKEKDKRGSRKHNKQPSKGLPSAWGGSHLSLPTSACMVS
jgi:hypothetical protein